jgi:hypothetical protein
MAKFKVTHTGYHFEDGQAVNTITAVRTWYAHTYTYFASCSVSICIVYDCVCSYTQTVGTLALLTTTTVGLVPCCIYRGHAPLRCLFVCDSIVMAPWFETQAHIEHQTVMLVYTRHSQLSITSCSAYTCMISAVCAVHTVQLQHDAH